VETYFQHNRAAIKISGPEAQKLLNDVLTGTIPKTSENANWWALLSPQGKIQVDGMIGWVEGKNSTDIDNGNDGGFYLDVACEAKAQFLRRLNMFKLRADAKIEDLSASHDVGWRKQPDPNSKQIEHKDAREEFIGMAMGTRIIAKKSATENWINNNGDLALKRINLGLCQLAQDFAPDNLFPHDIGMDLLGGIDFSKGCYVGQEVVSRMRHKGVVRKRPVIVTFIEGEPDDIKSGEEIVLENKKIGVVGKVIKGKSVGIVRLDRIEKSQISNATICGHGVILAVPSWASYDFA